MLWQIASRRPSQTRPRSELLEARLALDGAVEISEFMASNQHGLIDEDGAASDWIELHNTSTATVNLAGWSLSDNAAALTKWQFPNIDLAANGYLVVFASGKDRTDPAHPLHTNFNLSADGEYLALVEPDGVTVSSSYNPTFPPQYGDVSYGVYHSQTDTTLLTAGASGRVQVPSSGALGDTWTAPSYNDTGAGWTNAQSGVGFGTPGSSPAASNLLLWLDANDPSTLTQNANTVTGWRNKVATTDLLRSEVGHQPLLVNGPNGGKALQFDGVDDTLRDTTFSRSASEITVFIVAAPSSNAGGYRTFFEGNSNPNGNDYESGINIDMTGSSSPNFEIVSVEGAKRLQGELDNMTSSYPFGGYHLIQVNYWNNDGATFGTTVYVDGKFEGSRSSGGNNISLGSIRVGSRFYGGTETGYLNGKIAEVLVYDHRVAANEANQTGSYLATKYALSTMYTAPPLVATNIGAAMAGVNATAYMRFPFNLPGANNYDRLQLQMQYDDGFVAYLNGVQIASRNAPAALSWNSTATAEHLNSAQIESIDVSAFRNLLQSTGNVLAIQGLNLTAADSDFLVLPRLLGSVIGPGQLKYFDPATPGVANSTGYLDLVQDVAFSVTRGFYDAPFDVTLSTPTAGATIRYTTDGSAPTETTGLVYSTPLHVAATTTLRAAAFKSSYRPSLPGTNSYLFLADILTQPAMDQSVINSPAYSANIRNDFLTLPTLSLTIKPDDMFGANGIYTNPFSEGDAWEKPVSAELIYPDGSAGFQINAGVEIQGQAGRGDPKKSLQLLFKSQYGPTKLDFPLMSDTDVHEFNTLVLRAEHNTSWQRGDTRGQEQRDLFAHDTQRDLGQPHTFSQFVQVYINGQYWGMYNATERPDDAFAAEHFGDQAEDYDVIRAGEASAGDRVAWDQLLALAAAGPATSAQYDAIKQYVDPANLIDYMLTIFYEGEQDASVCICDPNAPRNFYAIRKREAGEQFRFFTWDHEFSLLDVNQDQTFEQGLNNPAFIFKSLLVNPDFRQLLADRIQLNFFGDGALTPAKSIARYLERANEIRDAVVAESARWGDQNASPALTRDGAWQTEQNRLVNNYFPQRTAIVLAQLQSRGWISTVTTPVIQPNGGNVPVGTQPTITAPNGSIYYTTDGTDPRAAGGGVAPGAVEYSPSVTLVGPTANVRSFVPANGSLGAAWTTEQFIDNSWSSGPAPLGYYKSGVAALPTVNSGTLVLRLDANTGVQTDASGFVNQWTDQSSFHNDLTAAGNQRPKLIAGGAAGVTYPVIDFDGVDDHLQNLAFVSAGNDSVYSDLTIFLVTAASSNNGGFRALLSGVPGPGGADYASGFNIDQGGNGSGSFNVLNLEGAQWNGQSDLKNSDQPFNQFHVLSLDTNSGGATQLYVDGVAEGTRAKNGNLANLLNLRLGSRYYGAESGYYDGYFAGVMVFEGNLSDVDRQSVENYLLNRFPVTPPPTFGVDLATAMYGVNASIYVRSQFAVNDPGSITTLSLNMKYDDGFVAYLNGQEVARRNAPAAVQWNSPAAGDRPLAASAQYETIDLTAYRNLLHQGNNVLAIQGLNDSASSYDFLLAPELVAQRTALPPTLTHSTLLQARSFDHGAWSPLASAQFYVNAAASAANLAISEVQYHPAAPTPAELLINPAFGQESFEFLEIENTSGDVVDLTGVKFMAGINFDFANASITELAPGQHAVLAVNLAAYAARYGGTSAVIGQYTGNLSNGGEQLLLVDRFGATIRDFTYIDSWYYVTDGDGRSLVPRRPNDPNGLSDSVNWRASRNVGGSPGLTDPDPQVSGRYVFYNNSKFDGASASPNSADNQAIASDKTALLPGQKATFANYTSYTRGLNGVMVDIVGSPADVMTAADFEFRFGNSSTPAQWLPGPAPLSVSATIFDGFARAKIIFADGAIRNQWLQVTVLPTAKTGLVAPSVFYFGNMVGESGNSAANADVSAADEIGARNNLKTFINPAGISDTFDFNRDGFVNAADQIAARGNVATGAAALQLIDLSGAFGLTGGPSASLAVQSVDNELAAGVRQGLATSNGKTAPAASPATSDLVFAGPIATSQALWLEATLPVVAPAQHFADVAAALNQLADRAALETDDLFELLSGGLQNKPKR